MYCCLGTSVNSFTKQGQKRFQIQIRVNHVLTAQVQLKSFQNKSNRSVHCTRTRIAWQREVSNENTDLSAYRQKLKGHGTFSLTQPSHEDPGTLEEVPAHSIRTSTRRNPSLSSIQVFLTCGTLPPFFPAAQGWRWSWMTMINFWPLSFYFSVQTWFSLTSGDFYYPPFANPLQKNTWQSE